MNAFINFLLKQPITIAVGTILAVFSGILAVTHVPVRMTPEVSSVVIAVTTNWENASVEEIESDIIEEQEKVLGEVTGLKSLISTAAAGQGSIRLEFENGTDIAKAQAEVLQKLDEVPGYPSGVLRPVVEDYDPESADYIAWIGIFSSDPDFSPSRLYDFMDRSIKPRFESIPGISQVGVRGATPSELQIIVDPAALAQRGITFTQLRQGILSANANFSGGKIELGKRDFRLRATGRFDTPEAAAEMVIYRDENGSVTLGDVAEIRNGYKEPTSWVRSRGQESAFFNFQLQRGANLLETMRELLAQVDELNQPGNLLDQKARQLGLDGKLELVPTYDASTYVEDAFVLVRSNLVFGAILATLTLLFFLRSVRAVGIIAIAIPVSVIASFTVLVVLGRSINIISLAGLAFAVGMVVDNAIVVIENIYRHLEKGKNPLEAARDGAAEVGGAVLASTMTTVVVFAPILLIQEEAGQLFRDIALAIMAAVSISFFVSLTLIPVASGRMLSAKNSSAPSSPSLFDRIFGSRLFRLLGLPFRPLAILFDRLPDWAARSVSVGTATWPRRLVIIATFTAITLIGTRILLPPLDYLPSGNRNLAFGLLFPPPTYNLDKISEMGEGIEKQLKPLWDATPDQYAIETRLNNGNAEAEDRRESVPLNDGSGQSILPPPLENYFLVSFEGRLFHGAISADKSRVVDIIPALQKATSGIPDTFAISKQMPLFRVGGSTGGAIQIDFRGRDLDRVSQAAAATMGALFGSMPPGSNITPAPPNFALPLDELRLTPNDNRLQELGMTRTDLGLATQAGGDGIILFRNYEQDGELKDIKILTERKEGDEALQSLLDLPIATPSGDIVDLRAIAQVERVLGPDSIRHVDRQRAVTLELEPPTGQPLETVITQVTDMIENLKANGTIPTDIDVQLAGSAGKLAEIKNSLLGDGTLKGTVASSLFMAFLIIYLLMVILFQSWTYPLVIMLSVPLATFGGFLGLALVHHWSKTDRYMPIQNLDMLTILGFVILAGVVVNNAILIVHQALNFIKNENLPPHEAVIESVRSRVRPILMATLTSVGGMLPLVLVPGAGSELYRGLGAVIVGGLTISTIFTMILVPTVLSAIFALRPPQKVTA